MNRRPAVFALAALVMVPLSACGSPNSADACEAVESSATYLDAVIDDPDSTPDEAKGAFSSHVDDLGRAADIAEGEVRLTIQEAHDYAAEYESSFSEDSGVAYFMQRNRVVDACAENHSSINLD
ncbi:hypothetical protein [Arthrobacter sp. CP30]